MILITGGCCQGKLDWAAEQFALRAEEILDGASCSLEAATYADAEQSGHPADAESGSSAVAEFGSPVAAESGTPIRALNHFHLLVRRWMDAGEDAAARTEDLLRVNPGMVILTDEIGSGIIPMDGFEREYREVHGRICCRLAQEADAVIRVVCGIGTWIKGEPKLFTIRVIRHGQTFGNTKRRFLGRTDEPLWEGGIRELERLREKGIWGEAAEGALFSSPMLRCLQTAQILFPGSKPTLLPGMIECDFGIMENKNHEELDGDPQYQAWIDSGGRAPFPGGESLEEFSNRIVSAYGEMLDLMDQRGIREAALVCHGGSIMSIMDVLADPHRDYFTGIKGNGSGYLVRTDYNMWKTGRKTCTVLEEIGD